MNLNTRKNFADMINNNKYLSAVEIGVGYGGFSEYLLTRCPNLILTGIDPWDVKLPEGRDGMSQTVSRTERFYPRYRILKMMSTDALPHFVNNSLDFVYIDGNHSFMGCLSDMITWWDKLKKGGTMAGHDYHSTQLDVIKAVKLFTKEFNLELNVTGIDGSIDAGEECSSNSWWITKEI